MNALTRLVRRLMFAHPQQPLVYVCSNNGVTAAVRGEDYDRALIQLRKDRSKKFKLNNGTLSDRWNESAVYPSFPVVYPQFLFSNKLPEYSRSASFRIGSIAELQEILKDCAVEYHQFWIQPIQSGSRRLNIVDCTWEQVHPEYRPGMSQIPVSNVVWSLQQATDYLHGKPVYYWNDGYVMA
ncbi:hypothetical protein IT397_00220 [Candidatus Nomurabacteria bacterium]|nr:hypothetical protein [Candidatus Nomurabacteria bacterium]